MKKIAYRNDEYQGNRIKDPASVIAYEIFELENLDIPIYILNIYGKTIKTLDPKLYNRMNDAIEEINNIGFIDDISETERHEFAQKIVNCVETITGKKIKSCLWLTDYDSVVKYYDGDEYNISGYEISDVILSDLGSEGVLYCYEKQPVMITER